MTSEQYFPGLEGVIAGETAISTITGGLSYRGYSISDLAEQSTFPEVAYLLLHGELPNEEHSADFKAILDESAEVAPPIIDECPYNMECEVVGEHELGEWVMILGRIVETHADADKVGEQDGKLDMSRVNPLIYFAVVREYWEPGRKLGDGFSAGRQVKPEHE